MSGIAGKLGAVFKNYALTDKSKLIADFQDDETWTSGTGTQTDDATNFRLGTESIRITSVSDALQYSDQNGLTLNLNQFESTAVSDANDYIYAIFYVSDATKVANVIIGFDADTPYDGSNAYTYTITSVDTGWNYVKIIKSAFTEVGTGDWAAIESVRVSWTGQATSSGAYVSFQALYLVNDDFELILTKNTAYTMEQQALFTGWGIDSSITLLENSDLQTLTSTNGAKTYQVGLDEFTINAAKFYLDGDYLADGSACQLLLFVDYASGYRYEGSTLLNSGAIALDKETLITENVGFTGTSKLIYTSLQIISS